MPKWGSHRIAVHRSSGLTVTGGWDPTVSLTERLVVAIRRPGAVQLCSSTAGGASGIATTRKRHGRVVTGSGSMGHHPHRRAALCREETGRRARFEVVSLGPRCTAVGSVIYLGADGQVAGRDRRALRPHQPRPGGPRVQAAHRRRGPERDRWCGVPYSAPQIAATVVRSRAAVAGCVSGADTVPLVDPWVVMHTRAEFAALRERIRSFVFLTTAFFLTWCFLYVLLTAFAPHLMATKAVGNINVGLIFGLLQFVSTFAITTSYVRFANKNLDPISGRIREQLEGGPW